VVLPGLRDHHHDGLLEGAAGHEQELEDVVEAARVAPVGLHDGEQALEVVPEELRLEDTLPGAHPVRVAAERVDLAVVAHEAKRLRAVPAGEGVRREARMHHGEVRGVALVVQVGEEGQDLVGREHPLVDHDLRGEAAEVEQEPFVQRRVAPQQVAGALADEIELALEGVAREVVAGGDDEHLHVRHARPRRRADVGPVGVRRHLPPSDQALPVGLVQLVDARPAPLALLALARHVDEPGPEAPGTGEVGTELLPGHAGEERLGQRREDPGAVPGVLLAAAGAAVVHAAEHVQRIEDHLVAPLALDVGDEADPAAVVLVARVVEALPGGRADRRRGPAVCALAHPASVVRRVRTGPVAGRLSVRRPCALSPAR